MREMEQASQKYCISICSFLQEWWNVKCITLCFFLNEEYKEDLVDNKEKIFLDYLNWIYNTISSCQLDCKKKFHDKMITFPFSKEREH